MSRIKAWLARAKGWFLVVLFRKPARRKSRAFSTSRRKDVEEAGQWYLKRDILDKLDEYMICARRMKKTDPDGYKIYSRIGATVVGQNTLFWLALGPRWKNPKTRPTFGAVALLHDHDEEEDDFFRMKFGYFRHYERMPTMLEPTNGQIYEVVIFRTRMDEPGFWGRVSVNFYVSVDDKGGVRPLLFVDKRRQVLRHKDAKSRPGRGGGQSSVLETKYWTYGSTLEADDVDRPDCEWNKQTPEERAQSLFQILVGGYECAAAAMRVAATKNRVTAAFGIDLLRTPYFFDDRDVTLNEKGTKRKIFHIVRTHPRTLATGEIIYVKSHFRGERRFKWNGYDVVISMPGKHHKDLLDAPMKGHLYAEDEDEPPGMIPEGEAFDRVAKYLER